MPHLHQHVPSQRRAAVRRHVLVDEGMDELRNSAAEAVVSLLTPEPDPPAPGEEPTVNGVAVAGLLIRQCQDSHPQFGQASVHRVVPLRLGLCAQKRPYGLRRTFDETALSLEICTTWRDDVADNTHALQFRGKVMPLLNSHTRDRGAFDLSTGTQLNR